MFRWRRKEALNKQPTLTERDWLFIKLCQDDLALEKWKDCAQKLISSETKFNKGEVQLLLDALSEDPHPDRIASILLVMESAMKTDDTWHELLASSSSIGIITQILTTEDKSNIYQLGEVLLQLRNTSSEIVIKALVPVLLDQIRRNIDLEEGRTPIFHDALKLLKKWIGAYQCWVGVDDEELLTLLTDVLTLYPYDLDALHVVFYFLLKKDRRLKYANRALFCLIAQLFMKTTIQRPALVEDSQIVAWLAAGIMCLLAQIDKKILQDVIKNHFSIIATLKPVVEEERKFEIPLQVIDSIMSMLIEASRCNPSVMRHSAKVLWKMKMESPWAIKTTIRKVLVNIGEAVDRRIALKDCTSEHLKQILFEHGIRQECIDRLYLTGEQFLDVLPESLGVLLDLTKDETEMIERIQRVYQMMVKISQRERCARITHEEMEGYLSKHFCSKKNKNIIKPVRSLQSLDTHYYFHALMDVAHLLDDLDSLDNEP